MIYLLFAVLGVQVDFAMAMAFSRGWRHLTTPGILCGLHGYAIANLVGITLAEL